MGSIPPPSELAAPEGRRVFISYKRNVEPDASVAAFLRDALGREGHSVFIDVEMVPGTDWPESISAQIREAEFFVVLLSKASLAKGSYVPAETLVAHSHHEQTGSPTVVPVRLSPRKTCRCSWPARSGVSTISAGATVPTTTARC